MNKSLSFIPTPSTCLTAVLVSFALSLAGCTAPAGSDSTVATPGPAGAMAVPDGRIIVKFQPGVDPASGVFLQELSAALRVTIAYSHPLSGDAHVLNVRGYKDGAHWRELLAALNRRAEVVYAEPDARMRHQ